MSLLHNLIRILMLFFSPYEDEEESCWEQWCHGEVKFILRWWKDAEVSEYSCKEGVLYMASSWDDDVHASTSNDIVLRLKNQSGGGDNDGIDVEEDDQGEGFSGREYALISESMWFKVLKCGI